jgi:hypothetical protein
MYDNNGTYQASRNISKPGIKSGKEIAFPSSTVKQNKFHIYVQGLVVELYVGALGKKITMK